MLSRRNFFAKGFWIVVFFDYWQNICLKIQPKFAVTLAHSFMLLTSLLCTAAEK